jgi:hypothetical protein
MRPEYDGTIGYNAMRVSPFPFLTHTESVRVSQNGGEKNSPNTHYVGDMVSLCVLYIATSHPRAVGGMN